MDIKEIILDLKDIIEEIEKHYQTTDDEISGSVTIALVKLIEAVMWLEK